MNAYDWSISQKDIFLNSKYGVQAKSVMHMKVWSNEESRRSIPYHSDRILLLCEFKTTYYFSDNPYISVYKLKHNKYLYIKKLSKDENIQTYIITKIIVGQVEVSWFLMFACHLLASLEKKNIKRRYLYSSLSGNIFTAN